MIRVLKENLFFFQFNHVVDKRSIMHNGPWSFDKNLVVLSEFDGTDTSEICIAEGFILD